MDSFSHVHGVESKWRSSRTDPTRQRLVLNMAWIEKLLTNDLKYTLIPVFIAPSVTSAPPFQGKKKRNNRNKTTLEWVSKSLFFSVSPHYFVLTANNQKESYHSLTNLLTFKSKIAQKISNHLQKAKWTLMKHRQTDRQAYV